MSEILIFAGTTEGRRLSEILSKEKIKHTICVATKYGEEVLESTPYLYEAVSKEPKSETIRAMNRLC